MWGRDRATAIARTICALEEMVVEGVATTIPADLAILRHPDFAAVEHSTKWVEERLDLSRRAGDASRRRRRRRRRGGDRAPAHDTVEVNGKRFDVTVWVPESDAPADGGGSRRAPARKRSRAATSAGAGIGGGGRRRDRTDAGHDRQGARRASARPSAPATPWWCWRR